MRKFLLITLAVVSAMLLLTACPPAQPQQPEYEEGYYVIFSFQFKGVDEITLNENLKMTYDEEKGEYVLKIKKKDLAPILEGHDKNGVYWWNVVQVTDPTDTSKWIFYGGTDEYDPSVPFLKEDFDVKDDDFEVVFYAKIPDSTDTIVGFGDNLKDGRKFYIVGTKDWNEFYELKDEDGDGVYEGDVPVNYYKEIPFKIAPYAEWPDADTPDASKALYFNGKNYYATGLGDEGIWDVETKYATEVHVKFDVHHSTVEMSLKDGVPFIRDIKEQLVNDPSKTIDIDRIIGVVTYVYRDYVVIQDDTDAIEVYKKYAMNVFKVGSPVVFFGGTAQVYDEHYIEISNPDSSEVVNRTFDVTPQDITGYYLDGEPAPTMLFGRLVEFKGTVTGTDDYGNVFFSSEGTSITVKNYIDYNFEVGKSYTVKGVILWNYDRYKVVPRDENDVIPEGGIAVDADISDWDSFTGAKEIYEDAAIDNAWPDDSIFRIGAAYDDSAKTLYLFGIFKKSGTNNLMFLIGATPTALGSDTTFNHPWNRYYKLLNTKLLYVIETWKDDFDAWSVNADGEFVEVKGSILHSGTTDADGNYVVEIAIPNFEIPENGKVNIAAVLTGGYDGTKQWLSDAAPDQPDLPTEGSDGGFTAPATISEYIELP